MEDEFNIKVDYNDKKTPKDLKNRVNINPDLRIGTFYTFLSFEILAGLVSGIYICVCMYVYVCICMYAYVFIFV
jgi:hypothetical protein